MLAAAPPWRVRLPTGLDRGHSSLCKHAAAGHLRPLSLDPQLKRDPLGSIRLDRARARNARRCLGSGPSWLFVWPRGATLAFFFQAEDGIRDLTVTGVQTCALPI